MTDDAAFLRDVLAYPDDDEPRLVYADWLDERGDPRGEFIRVQVELARTDPDDDRHDALSDREAELLLRHGRRWLAELPDVPHMRWGLHRHFKHPLPLSPFRRGFAEAANFSSPKTFKAHFAALWEQHPVRFVAIERMTPRSLRGLLDSDLAVRLRGLYLPWVFGKGTEVVEVIAGAVNLSGLSELGMAGTLNGSFYRRESNLHRLLESEHLRRLKWLDVSRGFLQPVDLSRLLEHPISESLHTLRLRGALHWEDSAETLAQWKQVLDLPNLLRLRTLDIGGCRVKLPAVACAPRLRRLTDLRLDGTTINRADWAAVVQGSGLSQLRMLTVARVHFPDVHAAADALATGSSLDRLRHLNFAGWKVDARCVEALATSPRLANLRYLNLAGTRLDERAADVLLEAPHWDRMVYLNVGGSGLSDSAVRRLRKRYGPALVRRSEEIHLP